MKTQLSTRFMGMNERDRKIKIFILDKKILLFHTDSAFLIINCFEAANALLQPVSLVLDRNFPSSRFRWLPLIK